MNFKLLTPLPRKLVIAFSGGVDSVAATDFLSRSHELTLAYVHHGTKHSEKALEWVQDWAKQRNLPLEVGYIVDDKPKEQSWEEHWREGRYQFLQEFAPQTVITAHHLSDSTETYLWSAMHGKPKTIPIRRDNIVRPFLTTPKQNFINWCIEKKLDWCEDESNSDTRYIRNYIRQHLMPHALHVNPGLHKVVKRMIEAQANKSFLDSPSHM